MFLMKILDFVKGKKSNRNTTHSILDNIEITYKPLFHTLIF